VREQLVVFTDGEPTTPQIFRWLFLIVGVPIVATSLSWCVPVADLCSEQPVLPTTYS
jgi:hypothetical protein